MRSAEPRFDKEAVTRSLTERGLVPPAPLVATRAPERPGAALARRPRELAMRKLVRVALSVGVVLAGALAAFVAVIVRRR